MRGNIQGERKKLNVRRNMQIDLEKVKFLGNIEAKKIAVWVRVISTV